MSATRHRACSVHVIEADSLSNSDVIVADSLQMLFKQTHYRVTSSVDEINHCLLIRACYTHVAELVSFVSTTCM